jgi:type II secretory pathway component PulM
MLRYSLLRILLFLGVLSLLWLLGLRDRDQQWMLLVLSALISLVLSYFVLARFREEATETIAARVERRAQDRRSRAADSDEAAEDAEADARQAEGWTGQDAGTNRPDDDGPVEYR